MSLELVRQRERGLVVEPRRVGDQSPRGTDPCDDRRRRRPQPATVRDPVDAPHVQAGQRSADVLERSLERTDHEVVGVGRHLTGALPLDLDADHGGRRRAHLDLVVDPEREAQSVEAGTQVRAGGGHTDPDVVGSELHRCSSGVGARKGRTVRTGRARRRSRRRPH
ncbi:hypothetical protein GCM10025865_22490 [Paraoerskovia sediminicola]|uniref:Uncharacterized protein n=1 Tax=Paraoerskovia sediminicola TaxID=1138587 RepID=A0ABM8G483_9CELL|nr:hypothetical protein GCM10025865_22490 [Paraoerskovia sediminicola]